MTRHPLVVILGATLASTAPLLAQAPPLHLPDASPRATVNQTAGMTDVTVNYGRPGVKGRKIWGGLVPWGEVWRIGANENTTIAFSTPVTVGGQKLDAGVYGLHTIPGEREWIVALSRQAKAWGSYSYDPKEDAVRLTVSPKAADFVEHLQFTLDDPTDAGVTVAMRWEKLKVAFEVQVDTKAAVVASLRQQLRGLPRFYWQGWNQAASWCARNDTNLDEAMAWADESLKIAENGSNLRTKATLVEKRGDARTASALREKAEKVTTEVERNQMGYGLMGQGKLDEALQLFERNVKEHPASWNVYDSLADAYARKGEKKLARTNYEKALSMAKDETQKKRIQGEIDKLK
jgi:hypothetical protein